MNSRKIAVSFFLFLFAIVLVYTNAFVVYHYTHVPQLSPGAPAGYESPALGGFIIMIGFIIFSLVSLALITWYFFKSF